MNQYPEHVKPPLSVVNSMSSQKQDLAAMAHQIAKKHRPSLRRYVANRVANAWQFVRAVTSLITKKRLSATAYEMRIEACLGCPELQRGNPLGHCKACGCGKRKLAELTIKANMPGAKCPLGKWDGNRA